MDSVALQPVYGEGLWNGRITLKSARKMRGTKFSKEANHPQTLIKTWWTGKDSNLQPID